MARIISGPVPDNLATPFSLKPYAGFIFGSALIEASLTGKAAVSDLCGGSDLAQTSTPVDNGYYATVTDAAYWDTPFNGDQLANAVSNQNGLTLIAVARVAASAQRTLISNFAGSGSASVTLDPANDKLIQAIVSPTPLRLANLPDDAARGARFAMYALTLTPTAVTVYERHAGSTLLASATTSFSSQAIGGAVPFRIGNRNDVSGDSADMIAALFDGRALTPTQINTRYVELQRWINQKAGATIL